MTEKLIPSRHVLRLDGEAVKATLGIVGASEGGLIAILAVPIPERVREMIAESTREALATLAALAGEEIADAIARITQPADDELVANISPPFYLGMS